jgi:hypothetical protein
MMDGMASLRFSLRTLLVLIFVCALCVGWAVDRRRLSHRIRDLEANDTETRNCLYDFAFMAMMSDELRDELQIRLGEGYDPNSRTIVRIRERIWQMERRFGEKGHQTNARLKLNIPSHPPLPPLVQDKPISD